MQVQDRKSMAGLQLFASELWRQDLCPRSPHTPKVASVLCYASQDTWKSPCEPTLGKDLKSRELLYSTQWSFPQSLTQEIIRHRKDVFSNSTKNTRTHWRGKELENTNLVFDELHCRVLKIQLIAKPHENWSKLIFPHSEIPVFCMVPGNQDYCMSKDRV